MPHTGVVYLEYIYKTPCINERSGASKESFLTCLFFKSIHRTSRSLPFSSFHLPTTHTTPRFFARLCYEYCRAPPDDTNYQKRFSAPPFYGGAPKLDGNLALCRPCSPVQPEHPKLHCVSGQRRLSRVSRNVLLSHFSGPAQRSSSFP